MDNNKEQVLRLKQWMEGEKPGPYSIEFYTDVGCNLFCKFCDTELKPVKHLDMEQADRLLDEAKEMGVKIARVIGVGDPFLKKKAMAKFMTKIKGYGMTGFTVTNATVIGEEEIKQLVKIGWDEIRISLHGPNPIIHDYLTGKKGAFETVSKNLGYFQKWKKEFGTHLPTVRINFVINKFNFRSIREMVSLCEEYSCDLVLLPLEVPELGGVQNTNGLTLSESEKSEYASMLDEMLKSYQGRSPEIFAPQSQGEYVIDKLPMSKTELKENFESISYQEDQKLKRKISDVPGDAKAKFIKSKCFDPWLNITVNNLENYGLCCPSVSFSLNNQDKPAKAKTLKEIWHGRFFEEMRQSILSNNLKEFCSFCSNTDAVYFSSELISLKKEIYEISERKASVLPEDIPREQVQRLIQWTQGKKPGPYSIELFTDNGCNLDCKFCGNNHKQANHLDFEIANELIEQGHELGVRLVRIIGGGDPFLKRKQLMDLIVKIKDYAMFGYVVTNGTLFNEEDIRTLVKIRWDELRISFHGAKKGTHDHLTGMVGSYDIVMKNLKLLRDYKKLYSSSFPRTKINFVLNKKNYDEIGRMAKLCDEFGCDFVVLPLEYPDDADPKFIKNYTLSDEEKKAYIRMAKNVIEKYKDSGREISIPMLDGEILPEKCEKKDLNDSFIPLSYTNTVRKPKEICKKKSSFEKFLDAPCYDPWLNVTIRDYSLFGVCSPSVSNTVDEKTRKNQKAAPKNLKELWYGNYYAEMRRSILNRDFRKFCSFCVNTDTEFLSDLLKKTLAEGREQCN